MVAMGGAVCVYATARICLIAVEAFFRTLWDACNLNFCRSYGIHRVFKMRNQSVAWVLMRDGRRLIPAAP
jgi:hypothetical protein